ncbi:MAG TPA: hypothetical protein VJO99_23190 [Burkholderiaceae bacterium]|nr:hypothetical protein [Burkholderiaceae bacterium]
MATLVLALGLALHGAPAAAAQTTASSSTGNAASAPPPGGRPPGPPPEAIAACQGKTEGTQVSFKLRNGETVSGVCQKLGDVLAARPLGGPPPGGPGGGQPPSR